MFPSTYEGFGILALEAMGLGCPVVAADIPALREVCADAAAYADPLDPADIAGAVARVLDDRAFRDHLSKSGRERAATFTWDRTADQLCAIVAGLRPERRPPA